MIWLFDIRYCNFIFKTINHTIISFMSLLFSTNQRNSLPSSSSLFRIWSAYLDNTCINLWEKSGSSSLTQIFTFLTFLCVMLVCLLIIPTRQKFITLITNCNKTCNRVISLSSAYCHIKKFGTETFSMFAPNSRLLIHCLVVFPWRALMSWPYSIRASSLRYRKSCFVLCWSLGLVSPAF